MSIDVSTVLTYSGTTAAQQQQQQAAIRVKRAAT